jgi:sugar-specific transcriptional regulator TrmB
MNIIENLVQFNLTRQEANLYLLLSTDGEMSGYEAARKGCISRSNAYAALSSLTDKGAVYRLNGGTPLYQALPIQDFCEHKLRNLKESAEALARDLPARREPAEGYLTITGRQNIIDRMRSMIASARERIYLALSPKILSLGKAELASAIARGVKVVVISSEDPALTGASFYQDSIPSNQIRLIADSSEVLTGELGQDEVASSLYSRRKQLVDLFKDALRNEIKLIQLGQRAED